MQINKRVGRLTAYCICKAYYPAPPAYKLNGFVPLALFKSYSCMMMMVSVQPCMSNLKFCIKRERECVCGTPHTRHIRAFIYQHLHFALLEKLPCLVCTAQTYTEQMQFQLGALIFKMVRLLSTHTQHHTLSFWMSAWLVAVLWRTLVGRCHPEAYKISAAA